MRPLAKLGVVLGGYVVAFAIASAVVAAYIAATETPDRQTYAAMYDFGDLLLWLGVFGLASIPATAAGLFFLRPFRLFWIALSTVALALVATSSVAVVARLLHAIVDTQQISRSLLAFASLAIITAPLSAGFFVLSGVLAPDRPTRRALLGAAALQVVFFGYWFNPFAHFGPFLFGRFGTTDGAAAGGRSSPALTQSDQEVPR